MVENTLQGKVLKNVKLYRVSPDAVVKVPAGGIPVFQATDDTSKLSGLVGIVLELEVVLDDLGVQYWLCGDILLADTDAGKAFSMMHHFNLPHITFSKWNLGSWDNNRIYVDISNVS